jgi:hypothetical protein
MSEYTTYSEFPREWINRRILAEIGQECAQCGALESKVITSTTEMCMGCQHVSSIEQFRCKLDPSRVEFKLDAQVCNKV